MDSQMRRLVGRSRQAMAAKRSATLRLYRCKKLHVLRHRIDLLSEIFDGLNDIRRANHEPSSSRRGLRASTFWYSFSIPV